MIDTIILKLHNVSNYPITKTKFTASKKTTVTTQEVDSDFLGSVSGSKISTVMFHDGNNIIPTSARSSVFIPSSHYLLSYFYKIQADTLEFNFSIPKFLYSHNVCQFIPYFDQDSKTVFLLLREFLKNFIKNQLPDVVSYSDIEVNRIDFCYNQFFSCQTDALRYLDGQKDLLIKYARSSKNRYKTFDTSLMYVTDRYSFKIYHKGAEFKANDKKQLVKKNPLGFNILDLEKQASRILRYEITFRRSMLNHFFNDFQLFNDHLPFDSRSRADCANFKRSKPDYFPYCIDYTNRAKTFFLSLSPDVDKIVNLFAPFDFPLFDLCFRFFWDYVKKFQIHPKLSLMDIQKNIDVANQKTVLKNTVRKKQVKIKDKTRLTMLALVAQSYPFEEIKKLGILRERTYYKYLKELKDIGVLTENRLNVDICPPSLDYLEYKYLFGRHHLK